MKRSADTRVNSVCEREHNIDDTKQIRISPLFINNRYETETENNIYKLFANLTIDIFQNEILNAAFLSLSIFEPIFGIRTLFFASRKNFNASRYRARNKKGFNRPAFQTPPLTLTHALSNSRVYTPWLQNVVSHTWCCATCAYTNEIYNPRKTYGLSPKVVNQRRNSGPYLNVLEWGRTS